MAAFHTYAISSRTSYPEIIRSLFTSHFISIFYLPFGVSLLLGFKYHPVRFHICSLQVCGRLTAFYRSKQFLSLHVDLSRHVLFSLQIITIKMNFSAFMYQHLNLNIRIQRYSYYFTLAPHNKYKTSYISSIYSISLSKRIILLLHKTRQKLETS